ncbi:hypothetical protein V6N13_001757 [Hibiscus sabdariffa]
MVRSEMPMELGDALRDLTRMLCDEEVEVLLFDIHPSKAPRIDGMQVDFYQRNWLILAPKCVGSVTVVLMVDAGRSWDSSKFQPLLSIEILHRIVASISPMVGSPNDSLGWRWNPDHTFFVKSAYACKSSVVLVDSSREVNTSLQSRRASLSISCDEARSLAKWLPLPVGWCKVNVDDAKDSSLGWAACGVTNRGFMVFGIMDLQNW